MEMEFAEVEIRVLDSLCHNVGDVLVLVGGQKYIMQ
jgi:hypothetical protein